MSMRNDYVVEVKNVPREEPAVVAERLTEVLKLTPEKAAVLVARMPGVITKPLPEERALRVVLRLQSAGLAAVHRRATVSDGSGSDGTGPDATGPAAADTARPDAPSAPARAAVQAPEPPREEPSERAVPSLGDFYASPHVKNPSGFDELPSLDATRIEEPPPEPASDPKLTPMSEAGFGAADVVLPVDGAKRGAGSTPTIVEAGPLSRPDKPPRVQPPRAAAHEREEAGAEEAGAEEAGTKESGAEEATDPTMVVLPSADPLDEPASAASFGRHTRATDSGSGTGAAPGAPADPGAPHLSDAIARDRDGGATLTEDELEHTPPPDARYRTTRSAGARPLTLTPPPDEVLKRSGVDDDQLSAGRERRRGRFGRRLSAVVALPVTLSWLLSAGFIYLLLPVDLRPELWVPMAAATAIAALSGALAAALATSRISRDVTRLRDDAESIAMGELSSPVRVRRDDELGDVAASVERLRISLQEALERLRKRR